MGESVGLAVGVFVGLGVGEKVFSQACFSSCSCEAWVIVSAQPSGHSQVYSMEPSRGVQLAAASSSDQQ